MESDRKNGAGNLILLFVRNIEPGRVKTRLAKTVGDKNALEVYKALLKHTKDTVLKVNTFRAVYYSNYLEFNDIFDGNYFLKCEQNGNDLGERMLNAFKESFLEGYEKVICIGSDCYELTPEIIDEAYSALDDHDVVIGPAKDGGYYLIGSKRLIPSLFIEKEWSTDNVLLDTIIDIKQQKLSHYLLPTLSDVDTEEDLPEALRALLTN